MQKAWRCYLPGTAKSYARIVAVQHVPLALTDVVSTIRQHRHFLCLSKFHHYSTWSLESMNFSAFLGNNEDTGSRIQSEWKDQRIFLAYRFLTLALNLCRGNGL